MDFLLQVAAPGVEREAATNAIVARSTRFRTTSESTAIILDAPARAAAALSTETVLRTERELGDIIGRHRQSLLKAATLDNVNIRGNTIEQIITGELNAHRLDDLAYSLPNGGRMIVDIKTKLLDRASAPKAYNIDKMLKLLSESGTVFSFFFLGLHVHRQIAQARLVSIFDPIILSATRVQTHWAGRASRGVTQLTGDLSRIFDARYQPSVDVEAGRALLRSFIER